MQKATVTMEGLFKPCNCPRISSARQEVYLKRVGKSVLLIPDDADAWDLLEESLERFSEDFMEKRGNHPTGREDCRREVLA